MQGEAGQGVGRVVEVPQSRLNSRGRSISPVSPEMQSTKSAVSTSRFSSFLLAIPLICVAQVSADPRELDLLIAQCVETSDFRDLNHKTRFSHKVIGSDGRALRLQADVSETKGDKVLRSNTTAVWIPWDEVRVRFADRELVFECIEGKCMRIAPGLGNSRESAISSWTIEGCKDAGRLSALVNAMKVANPR
jgi:hypothetical protein